MAMTRQETTASAFLWVESSGTRAVRLGFLYPDRGVDMPLLGLYTHASLSSQWGLRQISVKRVVVSGNRHGEDMYRFVFDRRWTWTVTAGLAAVLLATGCKKKPPEPMPEEPEPVVERAPVGVVSISPASADPETSFSATVNGSSFQQGATVTIGGRSASGVTVATENRITLTVPGMATGTYDVTVANPDGGAATLRSGLDIRYSLAQCQNVTVHFDYDSAGLSSNGRSEIEPHLQCLQHAGSINVEGHADERGTIDYNLALGQRRADTVKDFLASGGVGSARINTVSYGEERPAAKDHNESSWAQNRRAEVNATE